MEIIVLAVVVALAAWALLMWWMGMERTPSGRRVTVSLVDGSVLSGRTQRAWPGRLRLVDVQTPDGDVPGVVIVSGSHVLTVQVVG